MSGLKSIEKQVLENLLEMKGGYVLDFSDRTMGNFFDEELGLNIYDEKYNYASGSKANRMRGFWKNADNEIVGKSILKLIEYIEHRIILGEFKQDDYSEKKINKAKEIANSLLGSNKDNYTEVEVGVQADFANEQINISLNKDVFSHVQGLLKDAHYFNAVEESYKIVRQKLREITGEEQAHKAFSETNKIKIFGRESKNAAEKDFFEGIKFLHMAIQNLRNEKAHTPANEIDKNLAIHYIVLASLAYDLINRN